MYFLTKFSASISRLQWGSNWAHIYQHFFRSTKRLRERFKGWPLHYTQPPNGVLKLLIQLSLLFLFSVLIPSIFVLCFVYIEFSLWSLLKLSFWLLLKLAKAYANFSSSPSHKFPPVQHLSFCQPVAARLTQFSFHFFFGFFYFAFHAPSSPHADTDLHVTFARKMKRGIQIGHEVSPIFWHWIIKWQQPRKVRLTFGFALFDWHSVVNSTKSQQAAGTRWIWVF